MSPVQLEEQVSWLQSPWRTLHPPPLPVYLKAETSLANKGLYNQRYGFSSSHVWCESWIVKKAECQRIDAFELCWRRFLRVPWTIWRLNQSILKEINPEYSLQGLMLKLKIQYFGYLMWRADSLEKTLMFGKIKVRRRRKWHRMRWLDVITNWMIMNLSKLGVSEGQGSLVCYSL